MSHRLRRAIDLSRLEDNQSDVWGWEVIQAAGAFSDINQEVERRFAELPEPSFCDRVDDPEALEDVEKNWSTMCMM